MIKKLALAAMLISLNVQASALDDAMTTLTNAQATLTDLAAESTELTPELKEAATLYKQSLVDLANAAIELTVAAEETAGYCMENTATVLTGLKEEIADQAAKLADIRTELNEIATELVDVANTSMVQAQSIAEATATEATTVINELLDNTAQASTEKAQEIVQESTDLAAQALEMAKKAVENAKAILIALKDEASNASKDIKGWADKNPDLAILGVLIGGLATSAVIATGVDYWLDNHRTINSRNIARIYDLVEDLKNENLTFAARDRAYAQLKKYTKYQSDEFKFIHKFLTAPKGLLNSYQSYKKCSLEKSQFEAMAKHIITEIQMLDNRVAVVA